MAKLALAPLREIIREQAKFQNRNVKISGRGLEAYRQQVEAYAKGLADVSLKCMAHGKRKTLYEADVKLAGLT